MRWVGQTGMRRCEMHYHFLSENLKEIDHFGDLCMYENRPDINADYKKYGNGLWARIVRMSLVGSCKH
jgi:hypothetical protein